MQHFIHTTKEQGQQFYLDYHQKGKVVMLNLLRFKDNADYTDFPDLDPGEEITGKAAYNLYMHHTRPRIDEVGSKVLFFGKSNSFLIGPTAEQWDAVLLVEHPSVEKFMAFAQNEAYLKTAGHRTAALADSRLLPITEIGVRD
ncbi:MAG: DUF1330 domain-containing protein [Bacteroidota bacterium]